MVFAGSMSSQPKVSVTAPRPLNVERRIFRCQFVLSSPNRIPPHLQRRLLVRPLLLQRPDARLQQRLLNTQLLKHLRVEEGSRQRWDEGRAGGDGGTRGTGVQVGGRGKGQCHRESTVPRRSDPLPTPTSPLPYQVAVRYHPHAAPLPSTAPHTTFLVTRSTPYTAARSRPPSCPSPARTSSVCCTPRWP